MSGGAGNTVKAASRAEDVGVVGKVAAGTGSGGAAAAAGSSNANSSAQQHVPRHHGAAHMALGASALRDDADGEADECSDVGADADVDAEVETSSGAVPLSDCDMKSFARMADAGDDADVDERLDVDDIELDTLSGWLYLRCTWHKLLTSLF